MISRWFPFAGLCLILFLGLAAQTRFDPRNGRPLLTPPPLRQAIDQGKRLRGILGGFQGALSLLNRPDFYREPQGQQGEEISAALAAIDAGADELSLMVQMDGKPGPSEPLAACWQPLRPGVMGCLSQVALCDKLLQDYASPDNPGLHGPMALLQAKLAWVRTGMALDQIQAAVNQRLAALYLVEQ